MQNHLLPLISIQVSQKDKKIFFINLLSLFMIIILIGFINRSINKMMNKEKQFFKEKLANYFTYRFIKNKKELKKIAFKLNNITLYKESILPLLILIIPSLFLITYCYISNQNISYIFNIYNKLIARFSFSYTNYGIFTLPNTPTYQQGSFVLYQSFDAILAYLFLLSFIIFIILYSKVVLKYIARLKYLKEVKKNL